MVSRMPLCGNGRNLQQRVAGNLTGTILSATVRTCTGVLCGIAPMAALTLSDSGSSRKPLVAGAASGIHAPAFPSQCAESYQVTGSAGTAMRIMSFSSRESLTRWPVSSWKKGGKAAGSALLGSRILRVP